MVEHSGDNDVLFKGLADPSRRKLLDLLHAHDGRTLSDLCRHLDMTRQGVTQHLNLLESANLVATVWRGREKLHFLNPVPLQDIYERWIAKFETPRLKALARVNRRLEKTGSAMRARFSRRIRRGAACKHCSCVMDNIAGCLIHLRARDASFAAISRAPIGVVLGQQLQLRFRGHARPCPRWWRLSGVYHLENWRIDLRRQGRWRVNVVLEDGRQLDEWGAANLHPAGRNQPLR
jgi:DNA-binding transcriptional ArsR family regulator